MKLPPWLRLYWRELFLAFVITIPWFSLVILGIVWLWQARQLLPWAGGAAVLGLIAWPLRTSVHKNARKNARFSPGAVGQPTAGWNAREHDAWGKVEALAESTEPLLFSESDQIAAACQKTLAVVSYYYHPEAQDPWATFTLPEGLLLAERLSRDIRRVVLNIFPGARTITLGHFLLAQGLVNRHGPKARLGLSIWRIIRMPLSPATSLIQEVKGIILDKVGSALSYGIRAKATRALVMEVGRAAIDLYSGRLALSDAELDDREVPHSPTKSPRPIRVMIMGQVNAGKSSLLNAMAGNVRCAVSSLPTSFKSTEHLLSVDGQPTVVLVDTAGASTDVTRLIELAERADLILWVASATQPARALDRTALDAIRARAAASHDRPAPILLALTHVDQLRPAGEWKPPYNITAPLGTKATTIRAAVDAVARTLDVPVSAIVPVANRQGDRPYGAEAVWVRMAIEMTEAQLRQMDLLRGGQNKMPWKETANQIIKSGQFVTEAAWEGIKHALHRMGESADITG
jgi:small GTP-binding protein